MTFKITEERSEKKKKSIKSHKELMGIIGHNQGAHVQYMSTRGEQKEELFEELMPQIPQI